MELEVETFQTITLPKPTTFSTLDRSTIKDEDEFAVILQQGKIVHKLNHNPETYPFEIIIDCNVYFDEYDTKTGHFSGDLTKMLRVYITIENLPYHMQSKREEIILNVLVPKVNLIKIIGKDKMIDSLNDLNSEYSKMVLTRCSVLVI